MTQRVVGVLGGMGPGATIEFMRRIVESTDAANDQEHIRLIVDCNPHVPDRTDFILGQGEDPRPTLVKMLEGLERAGAELVVMPCNTAHQFLADLQAASRIPILDWPMEVAREVSTLGLHRAGILATSGTLSTAIYSRALARFGIEAVVPGEGAQKLLMRAIYNIKHSGICDGAIADIERAVIDLAGRTIDGCLVACTEISWACRGRSTLCGVNVTDGMDAVVRRVVALAGGRLKDFSKLRA